VLRIIGGSWRGRKLRFPPAPEIRPTPDRVRETLFNWLGPRVSGARCLDLFAGSGALGLESLSRGAEHVTFVERDAAAARELRARLSEWGARDAQVEHGDALRFLGGAPRVFDIVFLDPPFDSEFLTVAAERLESGGWLAAGALIYVECAARNGLPPLSSAWTTLKSKQAGEVGYHLLTRA
jgi:16S rRNA (guanine966-N2)-methyltransferase